MRFATWLTLNYRALFVKNLRYDRQRDGIPTDANANTRWNSYNVSPEDLFDLFGKFGAIRYAYIIHREELGVIKRSNTDSTHSQVRQGIANNTKGTAFVVYEDVMDAKQACDKLNGFNFQNRYLVGMLDIISSFIRIIILSVC